MINYQGKDDFPHRSEDVHALVATLSSKTQDGKWQVVTEEKLAHAVESAVQKDDAWWVAQELGMWLLSVDEDGTVWQMPHRSEAVQAIVAMLSPKTGDGWTEVTEGELENAVYGARVKNDVSRVAQHLGMRHLSVDKDGKVWKMPDYPRSY